MSTTNKPTALRQLTQKEQEEVINMLDFGKGAGYIIESLEEVFQQALNCRDIEEHILIEISNGYWNMRKVFRILNLIDPYPKQ